MTLNLIDRTDPVTQIRTHTFTDTYQHIHAYTYTNTHTHTWREDVHRKPTLSYTQTHSYKYRHIHENSDTQKYTNIHTHQADILTNPYGHILTHIVGRDQARVTEQKCQ